MLSYHYTAIEYLPIILEQGLKKGEVPLSRDRVLNGVWLTTDPDPSGHGLTDGGELTDNQCRALQLPVGEGYRFPDKRAVGITLVWPAARMTRWLPWARKRLDPSWLSALTNSGGGARKARSWWICFDPIPPSAFRAIDILRPVQDDAAASELRQAVRRLEPDLLDDAARER